MWSILANRVGEKWTLVEQKVHPRGFHYGQTRYTTVANALCSAWKRGSKTSPRRIDRRRRNRVHTMAVMMTVDAAFLTWTKNQMTARPGCQTTTNNLPSTPPLDTIRNNTRGYRASSRFSKRSHWDTHRTHTRSNTKSIPIPHLFLSLNFFSLRRLFFDLAFALFFTTSRSLSAYLYLVTLSAPAHRGRLGPLPGLHSWKHFHLDLG